MNVDASFYQILHIYRTGPAAGAQRECEGVPQQPEPGAAEGDAAQQRPVRLLGTQRRGGDGLQRTPLSS